MLDFCPYDFKNIEKDNLAYELTFPKNWSWEKVKEKTVIGDEHRKYIVVNDHRREEYFRENTQIEHIILAESRIKGGKNGLKLLLESINRNNEKLSAELERKEAEQQDDIVWIDENKSLSYNEDINGVYTFLDYKDDIVMYAIPCCPKCHCRFPIGWNIAEDFGAVSLMASSGGGKTAFLLSMMNKNWQVFQHLGEADSQNYKINITPAHRSDIKDIAYYEMNTMAENMCKPYGHCPQHTTREYWIPPVFLNIKYNNHTMIIGIYDNAGENLQHINIIENPNLRILLDKMFAEMYLFDPKYLNIMLPKEKNFVVNQELDKCEIMSIEEQGEYQKNHSRECVLGKDLIHKVKMPTMEKKDVSKVLEVYKNHLAVMQQENCLEHLKEMYFLGIIIKSDLLEETEEIQSRTEYKILFDREIVNDIIDKNMMDMRSELVQRMIKELHLFDNIDIDDFKIDFGEIDQNKNLMGRQAVSWHCISALGCDTEDGKLEGNYAPIRVAEPLTVCILKRIADNGWL